LEAKPGKYSRTFPAYPFQADESLTNRTQEVHDEEPG
jgi:hypothetical protein